MNKETKSMVTKTIKIAGVTCIALGGVALIASRAALKAMTEGAKYLKDAVKKIVRVQPESVVEEPAADPIAEETPSAEPVEAEANFAEGESQEA